MAGTDDEIERWERIRDRQIAARDPSVTRKTRYQRVAQRQTSNRKKMTFSDIVHVFSYKVIGFFTGLLLGFIAWVVMSILLIDWWVDWAGLITAILLSALGILVGASFDWRQDLRDF